MEPNPRLLGATDRHPDRLVVAKALEMMRKNPDLVYSWLDGVTTRDGQPARTAVEALLK